MLHDRCTRTRYLSAIVPCLLSLAAWEAALGELQVTATEPQAYELGLPAGLDQIAVTFDAEILPPPPGSVRVAGTMSGLHDVAVSADGVVLDIQILSGPFFPGEIVHVNLSGDLEGQGGKQLEGGFYFAFTVASGSAGLDFQEVRSFGASAIPYFIHGGDLDGDRTPDLAVPNEGTDDVSIFLNTGGQGEFPQHEEYPVGDKPSSIFGEDLDNDGDQDLATADIISGTISILRNEGGVFAPAATYPCGPQTRQIHGGDFDGDNDVDLCATSHTGGYVCLYRNDGTAIFTADSPYTDLPAGPFAIRTGDFNGDGHLDIGVACNDSDRLAVLVNDGTGEFSTLGDDPIGNGPWCLNGNDLDGDGDMDLVSVASYGNQFVALYNDGSGRFPIRQSLPSDNFPLGVYAADLDGDGDVDATSSNYGGASVGIYVNDGAGVFSLLGHLDVAAAGSYTWAHDLDGDGDLDLSVVDEIADSLFVFYNDGPASPVAEPAMQAATTPRIDLWPNPVPAGGRLTLRGAGDRAPSAVEIFGVDGRRIGAPEPAQARGGFWQLSFVPRDAAGRALPPGSYAVRLLYPGGPVCLRFRVLP